MDRRTFLQVTAMTTAAAAARPLGAEAQTQPLEVPRSELEELTISEMQAGIESGRFTSKSLVEAYIGRIEAIDKSGPRLNSIIELNPDAVRIAEELDVERKVRKARGPLHGIPIVIKDNIDTADRMKTSAGSLALADSIAQRDAFVTQRLREAGAVMLGKTNLSEWANFRSTHSSSGWSGRGGQTKNPYALDRNPCGSSSGSGAAPSANLCAAAIGTETDGSIVCPSNANSLVGIKPTLGLVSRAGIIPIAHSQDTAGPMARSVADAAILLTAIAGVDSRDAKTANAAKHAADYTKFLDPAGLKGARIGVARQFFGFNDHVDRLLAASLDALKSAGAILVDPADMETKGKYNDEEFEVLLYEFKADLNAYLAALPPSVQSRTLADLIRFNEVNKDREMPYFGQEIFKMAEEKGPLTDKKYRDALAKCRKLSRDEGIDAVVKKHKLDALVAPTGGPPWPTDWVLGDHFSGGFSTASAVAGYPHITVPAGYVFGLPVGLSFFGPAWSEPTLIRFAYAFEQATKFRRAPQFLPSSDLTPAGGVASATVAAASREVCGS
ncbi:MAG: amidase [Thermoanaerobaculia bacterium]